MFSVQFNGVATCIPEVRCSLALIYHLNCRCIAFCVFEGRRDSENMAEATLTVEKGRRGTNFVHYCFVLTRVVQAVAQHAWSA